MTNKTMKGRSLRRPSHVSVMLMLALGVTLGPVLIIDMVTTLQAEAL